MQPWNWQNPIGAKPISRAQLDAMTKVQGANQNEVCTHLLWDVQPIANAAAGPFNFFGTLQSDPTLGNMPLAGQLADPMFFIPQWMYCDYLVLPTAGTSAAFHPVDDIAELQVNQRAVFQISNGPKNYPVQGNYPLRAVGPIGGLVPYMVLEGATADPGKGIAYANGGIPGSQGFYIGGSWAIGPNTKFNVRLTVAAAPTLSATVRVMISFAGTLYQAVA